MFLADFEHVCRPKTGLNFADMRFAQKIHAEAGFADASADGEGHLVF